MYYILSRILKFLLFPMTWVLVLLTIAVFVKDKKHSNRRLLFFSIEMFVFLVFTNKPLLEWVQYRMTKDYAAQGLPDRYYPVAIVMGGFGNMNPQTGQMNTLYDRGGRLYETVRLQRMGIVGKILVTGDATVNLDDDGNSTAPAFREYLSQMGVPKQNILCEQRARSTHENATYSIAMLDSLGYTAEDCLLVTSATHIRRSLGAFAAEGWEVEPYAVNIVAKPTNLQLKNFTPQYTTLTDWQQVLNELFGNIAYRLA